MFDRSGLAITIALANRRAMVIAPPFTNVSKMYITKKTRNKGRHGTDVPIAYPVVSRYLSYYRMPADYCSYV